MIVTFYKTKLSANNRCYDGTAYENYLNSIKAEDKKAVTLEYDIIPNSNFYLPLVSADNQWQLYNYITFEYAGLKYGSFILSIQPLATDGTIEVRHTNDNWYYVKVNNLNVDFHGQCVRAHVNDLIKEDTYGYYHPTLKNTLCSAEEGIPTTKAKMKSINVEDFTEEALFIHIFFNNPTFRTVKADTIIGTPSDHAKYQNYLDSNTSNEISSIGLSCFGILNVKTGEISFDGKVIKKYKPFSGSELSETLYNSLSPTSNSASIYKDHSFMVALLTSNLITGICINNVPPNPYISIEKTTLSDGKSVYTYNYTKTYYSETLYNNATLYDLLYSSYNPNYENPNLPKYMPISVECQYVGFSHFDKENGKMVDKFYDIYTAKTILNSHITSDYNNYIKYGIVKANTSVYNPIYMCDTFILSTQLSDLTTIELRYSPDFTWKRYSMYYDDLEEEYARSIQLQNMNFFPPDTTYSMWDRLSALQTSYLADQQVVRAEYNLGNSLINLASSFSKFGSKDKFGAVANVTGSALRVSQSKNELDYTKRNTELTKRIAMGQYNEGNIKNYPSTGYYEQISKNNILSFMYLEDEDIKPVKINIHRYGYNTFLQLDEVYANHRRKYFNYIQTEDCDVNGVPLDIANDIENMFNSGVHLWSGTVEEWNVANWQYNIEVQNV